MGRANTYRRLFSTIATRRDGTTGSIKKERAFIEFKRSPEPYREPLERIHDWHEINNVPSAREPIDRKVQAARCMDCGTPLCQTHTGCPVNNLIPEWNELVFKNEWKEASDRLHKTNNFPEFTGRVCPAPCEGACIAGLIDEPVTIKNIEYAVIDRAFEEGWVTARVPPKRTGLHVAVIGSGPAGLACADQLNQMGHFVTVYEREDRIGGLLMYGIPNMKLEKQTVQRRVDLLMEEGIEFKTNASIGSDIDIQDLQQQYHAIALCIGSTIPRDLDLPGRDLNGIHFAMEFLTKNQKRLLMTREGTIESGWDKSFVTAEGKDVIVIGGGDTGTDCIGTAIRHRCKSMTNFEINHKPPVIRASDNPWPEYPRIYGIDYGHAEVRAVFGHDPREYKLMTTEFRGDENGNLKSLVTVQVDKNRQDGSITPVPGTEKEWPCDLAILALGFQNPDHLLINQLGLEKDAKENIQAPYDDYRTNVEGVFAAGDCRRGQSLVVWAIHEGREAASAVEKYFIDTGYLNRRAHA